MTNFARALQSLGGQQGTQRGSGYYAVAPIPQRPAYFAGLSAEGNATLLVRTSGSSIEIPVRLAGLSARYAIDCTLNESGVETIETLSIVECLVQSSEQVGYFAGCMDLLIAALGRTPSVAALSSAVNRLVEMFQALARPSRRETTGLIGELCVILSAVDPGLAVSAWHSDPTERYDFVSEGIRIDAKATSGPIRCHSLSADQADPPPSEIGLIASCHVRPAGGGTTVEQLIRLIVRRLGRNHDAEFRLREVIARTLGASLNAALNYSFDLDGARASLAFYDLRTLPALRPPFPPGVSDVRFQVDFSEAEPARLHLLRSSLTEGSARILPSP